MQVTILRLITTTITATATTTTTTTTAQVTMHAFSICATALGKGQPPLLSHSASYNIASKHHYHHHHSTSYNACIHYMLFSVSRKAIMTTSPWALGSGQTAQENWTFPHHHTQAWTFWEHCRQVCGSSDNKGINSISLAAYLDGDSSQIFSLTTSSLMFLPDDMRSSRLLFTEFSFSMSASLASKLAPRFSSSMAKNLS